MNIFVWLFGWPGTVILLVLAVFAIGVIVESAVPSYQHTWRNGIDAQGREAIRAKRARVVPSAQRSSVKRFTGKLRRFPL